MLLPAPGFGCVPGASSLRVLCCVCKTYAKCRDVAFLLLRCVADCAFYLWG